MAALVDAPDSKSGHFGGVGSIPSTPTTVLFFIAVNNKNEIHKKIKPSAYILKVNPKIDAEKPTIAGPNKAPAWPMLVIWEIVLGMGSLEILTANLITIGNKFDVKNPKIIIAKRIIYKFIVVILTIKITDPIIEK